jgi:predicted nucleic acid-binding protein
MIILDTNVLSETMRSLPNPKVSAWLDQFAEQSIWITAVTVFEVRYGIEILPPGRKRRELEEAFKLALSADLEGRVIPLDEAAAREVAILTVRRRQRLSDDLRDTLIAGIAISRGAAIATRNLRHFRDLPVDVVDPWG